MRKNISWALAAVAILAVAGGVVATRSMNSSAQTATPQAQSKPYIGVTIAQTPDGPAVSQVIAGSPAEKAGLQRGDVIKAIDGTSVSNMAAIRQALSGKKAGDTVKVTISRNGSSQDVSVTLEQQPGGLPGVYPQLPELNGIPKDQLFSHIQGGSFTFTDNNGKSHTVSVDLGTVSSVDANAKKITVNLNAGGSKTYDITSGVTTMPADLSNFQNGDKVVVVSVDGNLRAVTKGGRMGLPFFGGFGGMKGERGHMKGFRGEMGPGMMPSAPASPSVPASPGT